MPNFPWPSYVSVDFKINYHGYLTIRALAWLTGETVTPDDPESTHVSREECVAPDGQNVYRYLFLHGNEQPDWWDDEKEGKM